ncbi:flagellar hook-length control protein FliK, partial [Pandoraea sp. B-6]
LGTVDVTLGLSGQQLQARLLTDSSVSADVLSQEGEVLRQRLAAVGLIASQLSFGALTDAGASVGGSSAGANPADPARPVHAAAPTNATGQRGPSAGDVPPDAETGGAA